MDKPIFYCDCDGVILNTIDVGFNIMRSMGVNTNKRSEVDYYFKHMVDWNDIFSKAQFINNSIEKLKYLKESNIFKDVIILTKISGSIDEERLKRDLFKDVLPNVKVITLQYGLSKAVVVSARNNILLDDELNNCKSWSKEDGVAILFSPDTENCDENIVSNIDDVINTNGVKKLLKTRYF